MPNNHKVYIETSCFIEMAKHALGSGYPDRTSDIWHIKSLLEAGRNGKVEILTATLTIAECQHAEEPSTDGKPSTQLALGARDLHDGAGRHTRRICIGDGV